MSDPVFRVLLVDDDGPFRVAMGKALKRRGFEVTPLRCGQEAIDMMRSRATDLEPMVAVLDLRMPDVDGLEVLRRTPDRRMPVVMLTGHGSVPDAVEAMRLGAYTFLTKPVDARDLAPVLRQAARPEQPADRLVGDSRSITMLREIIEQVADAREPVLFIGAGGTGKQVAARQLHRRGCGPHEPFVVMGPDSETDPGPGCPLTDGGGILGKVGAGTLYVDELTDLSAADQKLLFEIIEQRNYRGRSDNLEYRFRGRVVVSSRKALAEEARSGRLHEGLYHRLQVLPLELVPLRDRPEDVVPIVDHWLGVLDSGHLEMTEDAVKRLVKHRWPGNIRELVNLVRRLALFNRGGVIDGQLVVRMLESNPFAVGQPSAPEVDRPPLEEISLEALERRHIEALMSHHKNISRVSRILGINRRTLQRKLRTWGLDHGHFDGA